MTIQKKILIFTATYNEKENIETLINSIFNNCSYADVLIIDDNSPDGTGSILSQLKEKNSNLKFFIRKSKLGLDTAHKYAYDYAIKNEGVIEATGYKKVDGKVFLVAENGIVTNSGKIKAQNNVTFN